MNNLRVVNSKGEVVSNNEIDTLIRDFLGHPKNKTQFCKFERAPEKFKSVQEEIDYHLKPNWVDEFLFLNDEGASSIEELKETYKSKSYGYKPELVFPNRVKVLNFLQGNGLEIA